MIFAFTHSLRRHIHVCVSLCVCISSETNECQTFFFNDLCLLRTHPFEMNSCNCDYVFPVPTSQQTFHRNSIWFWFVIQNHHSRCWCNLMNELRIHNIVSINNPYVIFKSNDNHSQTHTHTYTCEYHFISAVSEFIR